MKFMTLRTLMKINLEMIKMSRNPRANGLIFMDKELILYLRTSVRKLEI